MFIQTGAMAAMILSSGGSSSGNEREAKLDLRLASYCNQNFQTHLNNDSNTVTQTVTMAAASSVAMRVSRSLIWIVHSGQSV